MEPGCRRVDRVVGTDDWGEKGGKVTDHEEGRSERGLTSEVRNV